MNFYKETELLNNLTTQGKDQNLNIQNIKTLIKGLVNSKHKDFFITNEIKQKHDIKSNETYKEAYKEVKKVMDTVRKGNSPDISYIKEIVNEIVYRVLFDKNAYLYLSLIKEADKYTFLHSVDVCVLSVVIGNNLGLNKSELTTLGLGAMLHDVGKCLIPPEILLKPGKLTDEEFSIMKQHTVYGYEVLTNTYNIDNEIPLVALQHHEKWNASGYPNNLKSNDINKYARICTIADIYNAIVSTRVYKKGQLPHKASDFLLGNSSVIVDPEIMKVFTNSINTYSKDWIVLLNTGEVGYVLDEETFGLPKKIRVFANDGSKSLVKSYVRHLFNGMEVTEILGT